MGNTGIRKIFMAGDYVETFHDNLFDLSVPTLSRTQQPLSAYHNDCILIVNTGQQNPQSDEQLT